MKHFKLIQDQDTNVSIPDEACIIDYCGWDCSWDICWWDVVNCVPWIDHGCPDCMDCSDMCPVGVDTSGCPAPDFLNN